MMHALAVLGIALVLAIGLVLLVAGGEEDVLVEPAETTDTTTVPPATTQPATTPDDSPRRDDERAAIELAVARYISGAERGDVPGAGLPTSDDLSIAAIRGAGSAARVTLVGGAKLDLRKESGRWRVVRTRPAPIPAPTPPSNGP